MFSIILQKEHLPILLGDQSHIMPPPAVPPRPSPKDAQVGKPEKKCKCIEFYFGRIEIL